MDAVTFHHLFVERTEKMECIVGVVFPGIFAIENHADHMFAAVVSQVTGDVAEVLIEVRGRIAGIPLLVFETDHVREAVVAKEHACRTFVDVMCAEQAAARLFAV